MTAEGNNGLENWKSKKGYPFQFPLSFWRELKSYILRMTNDRQCYKNITENGNIRGLVE